jgi:hypothetical protein
MSCGSAAAILGSVSEHATTRRMGDTVIDALCDPPESGVPTEHGDPLDRMRRH